MTINMFRNQDTKYAVYFSSRDAKSAAQSVNSQKNNSTECKSCAERKYQDKSDDPGVSFKMSGHIKGSNSISAVAGHEREHETRESQRAEENEEYIVYSRIRIKMEQCMECKKMYSSGGETEVVTAKANQGWAAEINLFKEAQNKFYEDEKTGLLVNMRV